MNNLVQRISLLSVFMFVGLFTYGQTTTGPSAANNTTITFVLTDSFGDGWCGGNILVEGLIEEVVPAADGSCGTEAVQVPFTKLVGANGNPPFIAGTGPFEVECTVASGTTIDLDYLPGAFDGENDYTLIDGDGVVHLMGNGAVNADLPGTFGPFADVECNAGGTLFGALVVEGTDSFGDGWNGASIVLNYFDDMGNPVGSDNACATNFGTTCSEAFDVPAGGSVDIAWSASCGTFAGEITDWSVTYTAPSTIDFDPVTGTCVETPGAVTTITGNGCVAGGAIGSIQFDEAQGLDCPPDTLIVLEDGDCWPEAVYCLGVDVALPDMNMADFACPGFTADPIGLDLSSTVACNNLFDVDTDNNIITMMTTNGPNTGCEGNMTETCPGATFPNSGLSLTTVPVNFPAGYTSLVVDYTWTPDCTGNSGEDQFSYFITGADGTTIATITFLIGFPVVNGVQTGTETIDLTGLPEGAKIGFFMLSNAGAGVNGSATVELSGTFIDETGGTFIVGAENDEACDAEIEVDVDPVNGTVTIGYIPGVTEVCFIYDDGCTQQLCTFTVEVDNSVIHEQLSCNDHINVSVDTNCEALITADMVLEGGPYYCDDEYIIEITTPGGTPVANPLIYDPTYAPNNEYVVSVYDPYTCNSCWGTLTLEDKIPASIECPCPPGAWLTDPACNISCLDIERYIEGRRGTPTTLDNCGGDDAAFSGAQLTEVECGEYILEQIWTLTVPGYGGNDVPTTLTCVNQYYVTSPDLDEELDCPDDVEYDCTEGGDPSLTHPDETGYPEFGNIELGTGGENPYCNVFAGYDDLEIPACGLDCYGPIKILRTWSILDWCTGDTETCNQVIKIVDNTPPTVLAEDITVSTQPWVCAADVWFPDPHLHDDCTYDLDWYISWTDSGATLVDDEGRTGPNAGPYKHALGVPKGWWNFTISSADCCGNIGNYTITVHVIDKTPPVVVTTQNIVVSLTSSGDDWDGVAKLYKESVDNGSHDNCSDVWCEMRRDEDPCGFEGNTTYSNKIPEICDPWYDDDDHDYGEYVKFCCDDLDEVAEDGTAFGIKKVWIRVWDDGNMDGQHGSYTYYDNPGNDHDYCEFNDNYNEGWVWVRVEDKAPIALLCPPDVTIPCHWDYTDLSLTGEAIASATCSHPTPEYHDWPSIHCGEGFVLREWSVPGLDYVCVQTITIEYVESPLEVVCPTYQDFDGEIWFDPFNPNHVAVDCEDFEFPEPWVSGGKCSLIGVNERIDTFFFEADACFKAIKTWQYVDWCTGEEAFCEFVVSLIDTDAPEVMCQDTCFAVDDYWDADEDGNYCELASDVNVTSMASDEGACPSEWIKWVVHVDLWYDGTVDIEYSSFFPHNNPFYLAPTQAGEEVTIRLDKDDISAEWARHVVEWKAFDGCGNVSQCHQYVEVADKKAPTPYCVGISTALMSPEAGNLVEIWAKDFNLGSFDNCTAEHWLRYTFGEVPPVLEDEDGNSLLDEDHCFQPVWEDQANCIPARDPETGYIISEEVNNCNGYENGAQNPDCPIDGIQKWSPNGLDADGNPCKTSGMKFAGTEWCGENDIRISVWDKKLNMDFCWVNMIVHGVECPLDGTPRMISGVIATELGETVVDVEVTNTSDVMGITSMMTEADGVYAFEDNLEGFDYAITAEKDIDYLNGVSTLDVVLIQKHILGLTPLNSGYKMIAADINNDQSVTAVDLVELRKLILGIYTELPNNDSWRFADASQTLNVQNPWASFNEEVNISNLSDHMMNEDFVGIKIGDVNGNVVANATDIDVEERKNTNVEFVLETLDNGSIAVKAGANFTDVYGYQFTMSVAGNVTGVQAGAIDLTEANFGVLGNGIVTTSFASDSGVSLSEGDVLFTLNGATDITLVNGITSAEAYQGATLDIVNVSMRDGEGTAEFALAQNEPNPFSEVTNITFTLGQAGPTTLSVFDVTGKVVKVLNGNYDRGTHTIQLSKRELGTSGILYYQLESGDFTATKKMIILD